MNNRFGRRTAQPLSPSTSHPPQGGIMKEGEQGRSSRGFRKEQRSWGVPRKNLCPSSHWAPPWLRCRNEKRTRRGWVAPSPGACTMLLGWLEPGSSVSSRIMADGSPRVFTESPGISRDQGTGEGFPQPPRAGIPGVVLLPVWGGPRCTRRDQGFP